MKINKLRFIGSVILLLFVPLLCSATISITQMRINGLERPVGTDPETKHSFSWVLTSDKPGTYQKAYRIVVSSEDKTVWDSGKVPSDNSIHVEYEGVLLPEKEYRWTLQVWDNHGKVSRKASSRWQTGLLKNGWRAEWIVASNETLPAYFRKSEQLTGKVRRATAYITSHGIYEAFINGKRVGDFQLTPGWTTYNKMLQYQAYDVTAMLQKGRIPLQQWFHQDGIAEE